MSKKKYHVITNAHEAWWFIHEHPKLQRHYRQEVSKRKAKRMEEQGYWIERDERGGKCWHMMRHHMIPALTENLYVFYAKTDGKRVNDDRSKNTQVECWLELGPVEYGYLSAYPDRKTNWDMETVEQRVHDWRMDTGGKTFDEALIRMARNVRKFYGDYKPRERKDWCGKGVCADCVDTKAWIKKHGLNRKAKKASV